MWISGGFVGRALKSELWQRNMNAREVSDIPQADLDWYNGGARFPDRQGETHIHMGVSSVTACCSMMNSFYFSDIEITVV